MHGMKMNFSRAVSIIKSRCPNRWARAHAKAMPVTRERYGIAGAYVQVLAMLRDVGDWKDEHGAVGFMRTWAGKHREEAEHVSKS